MSVSEGLRVRWLTRYGPEGASSRYRVYQYLDALESVGIESSVTPLAPWNSGRVAQLRGVVSRLAAVRAMTDAAEVLVVQKEPVMPPLMWRTLRRRLGALPIPIVWDLDDAVWIGRSGARDMAEEMARMATVVVAGNGLLGEWASSAGASDVRVVPTCYSPASTPGRVESPADLVELVWIGSPATAHLLVAERSRLEQILAIPRIRLTMVGAGAPAGLESAHPIREVPWSPQAEHDHLCTADLGLALQPRTDYADHKCGFKIVQYLAYGVVPIVTSNDVHRSIVDDVGLLVEPTTTSSEIAHFVESGLTEALRRRAVQRWNDRYSTEVGVAAWFDILTGIPR